MVLLAKRYGISFILPLILGGVVYTAGAALEIFEPRPLIRAVFRSHELFHLAVLGGLTWHWRFIWMIAGMEGDDDRRRPKVVTRVSSQEGAIAASSSASTPPTNADLTSPDNFD